MLPYYIFVSIYFHSASTRENEKSVQHVYIHDIKIQETIQYINIQNVCTTSIPRFVTRDEPRFDGRRFYVPHIEHMI